MHSSIERQQLSNDEIQELHCQLRYYGRKDIENLFFHMFERSSTPLVNHWVNFDEAHKVYSLFCKMAKNLESEEFITCITDLRIPDIDLTKAQRSILLNANSYQRGSVDLFEFFHSVPEFFQYEMVLMELGYPLSTAA